jgi:hypothetical protein
MTLHHWLKARIITLIKLMRPPDAGQKQIRAPAPRRALESQGAMDRRKHLGSGS